MIKSPSPRQNGNTPLHTSAASGLKHVVELLVSHGAPLFVENLERLTPCDVAMKANFHDIALFLESRMVFVRVKLCVFFRPYVILNFLWNRPMCQPSSTTV